MFRTSPNFIQLLDKATSNLHLEPDWPTILQICDLIRQGDIQPKVALAAIKKKILNTNPHIALYGLLVLESCVKNCGSLIHNEIGTKQYMEQIKELVKSLPNEEVKSKTLGLIQAWAFAFRNSPKYTAIKDTVNIMKAEGYVFPELKESDAMFSADTAPAWADGDVCHRCRVAFSMVQRKHHCRACGQVFCSQCSNKTSTLPKYGIEKEVRVCDACYATLNKPTTTTTKDTDLPVEYLSSSLAQQQQVPQRKSDEELREEEELQLALALSQSEAEQKEKEKKRVGNYKIDYNSSASRPTYSSPPSPGPSPSKMHEEETDPELAKYLNRKFWEQIQANAEGHESSTRVDVTSPSAPNISSPMPQRIVVGKQQNGEIDNQLDKFVADLSSQVEIFVNRMKSNSSRGRSIVNDSFFQGLFMNITEMHSKLLKYIQKHDDTRVYYEGLQDKLTVVKEARAALDALREEHRERLRREAHEAERQKQIQMAMKLDIMRKKKQEYLNYQRQLALQKIQERERELQMRQEQQKQQYMMSGYQVMPTYMGPAPQGSPIRHVHYQQPGPNYNTMSPTNQTVYNYDQSHMGQYPMQNYGMPSMQSHMMPANPSDPQPPGPNDSMIQQRENMASVPQPNMMPQMPGVPQMTQIPGAGNNPASISVQMPPRMGQPPSEPPQGIPPGPAQVLPPNPSQIPQAQPQLRATGPPAPPPPPQAPPGVQMPQQMPHHVPNNLPGSIQMPNNPPPQPSVAPPPQMPIQYQQPVIQQPPVQPPPVQPPPVQPPPVQPPPPTQEVKKTEDTAELISFD